MSCTVWVVKHLKKKLILGYLVTNAVVFSSNYRHLTYFISVKVVIPIKMSLKRNL